MNVKEAMLRDVGSRDTEFISTVIYIRQKLLEIAGMLIGARYAKNSIYIPLEISVFLICLLSW